MLPDKALGALQAALQRGDPQFIILDPQKDFISDADTKCLAKRSRDHHATVLIDP